MMKKTKYIALALLLPILFCSFAGCSAIKFNAVLYSHADEWVDEDFIKDNKVKAFYLNDDYTEGISDPNEKYIRDKDSPSSRVFIINDEDEYNRIFSKSPINVNFEKEMVILYIFSDVNPYRKYKLKGINLEDNILTVQTKLEYKNINDTTMPYPRCFMLKMKKTEVREVKFTTK